jgi:hypothetical protein
MMESSFRSLLIMTSQLTCCDVITQVVIADPSLPGDMLNDEGLGVFKLRGLSLMAKAKAAAQASQLTPSKQTPQARFWSFRSKPPLVAVVDAAPTPVLEPLLHIIAPSPAEALEWKAALEVQNVLLL